MKKEDAKYLLQSLISKNDPTPQELLSIAKSYLAGTVLQDFVAAEAYLMRVVETEHEPEAFEAMVLYGREILGLKKVLSDADYMELIQSEDKHKLYKLSLLHKDENPL